jgi:hypothetical protein
MATRSEVLAQRVEQGAQALISAVEDLSPEQWTTYCDNEKRTVGVLVHHVGTMYPLEAGAVQTLAADGGLPGLTWTAVDGMNAEHAVANADVDKETAIALVRSNVAAAANAVRNLTDNELDRVAPISLNWDAPLSVQFFIEQHPVGHPYLHLESINAALGL